MGASVSTNIANVQQSFFNNITQQSQQNCISTSPTNVSNNTIIVTNSTISGNFTGVSVTTTTDASCLMVSNMDNSVSNILSSTLQQTNQAETDWFSGLLTVTNNIFNVNQSVTNNINQINQATCAANTITSINNNYEYISATRIGGDFIGFSTNSMTNASCSMSNVMKNVTYNQAQSSASQSNSIQGPFVAIIGTIILIVGIAVIAMMILHGSKSINHVGYQTVPQTQPAPISSDESDLQSAQRLGITPEMLSNLTSS